MGRRSDERPGDRQKADPPPAPSGEPRDDERGPPQDQERTQTERARREIAAGDVADDIADFA